MILKPEYRSFFLNFLRLTNENFEILVNRLGPEVSKKDTNCRHAIPVNESRAVTLRFIAPGNCYETRSLRCSRCPSSRYIKLSQRYAEPFLKS
jgi:hypothetical protein